MLRRFLNLKNNPVPKKARAKPQPVHTPTNIEANTDHISITGASVEFGISWMALRRAISSGVLHVDRTECRRMYLSRMEIEKKLHLLPKKTKQAKRAVPIVKEIPQPEPQRESIKLDKQIWTTAPCIGCKTVNACDPVACKSFDSWIIP